MKSPPIDNLISEAEILREQARFGQSCRLFKKALLGCEKTGDMEGIFYCVRSLGDMFRMTGCFEKAAEMYAKAVITARRIKSPGKVADAQIGMGLSLRAQGEWKRAIHLIRASKKLYEASHDKQGLAFALWAEAGALRIKGDIPSALKKFRDSRRLFYAQKDRQGVGYCMCGLGGASRVAGRAKASLKYYYAANKLFSDMRDTFGKAYSFCGIANAYRMLGDFRNAFTFFAKATRLYLAIGDKVSYAYTLWGLGTAYKMTGRRRKARTAMMHAMRLFRKTKDFRGIVYCRLGLGELAALNGDQARAARHLNAVSEDLKKLCLGVENCYAQTLRSIICRQSAVNMPAAQDNRHRTRGRELPQDSCYRRIGSKLRYYSLPLNFP